MSVVDQTNRRTFNADEYAAEESAKLQQDLAAAAQRAVPLSQAVSMDSVGGASVVSQSLRCDTCSVSFSDSLSVIRHIQSAKHQGRVGILGAVGHVGVDEVRAEVQSWVAAATADKAPPSASRNISDDRQPLSDGKRKRKRRRKARLDPTQVVDAADGGDAAALAAFGLPTSFT